MDARFKGIRSHQPHILHFYVFDWVILYLCTLQTMMPLPRLGLTRTPVCTVPARKVCMNSRPRRSSQHVAACASESVTQSWSCPPLLAALATASIFLSAGDCPIASAYNVRLKDVDSPELKAGEKVTTAYTGPWLLQRSAVLPTPHIKQSL